MAELGTRLKEARLSKGYSLDDLQEITKIQKRYLVGIEEGNYSIMPGSFYVRAFIKQYAEAVGLNPEEILETFKSELPGTPNDQVSQSLTQTSTRRKVSKSPSNKMMEAMPKVIVALFIIVIIVAIWVLLQSKSKTGSSEFDDSTPMVEYDKKPKPIDNEKEKEEEDKKAQANTEKEQTEDVYQSELAEIPGVGNVLIGGLVTYTEDAKVKQLGISQQLLDTHGIVSSECAAAMASAVRQKFGTSIGIGLTGAAGYYST
ncbi:Putative competence-damage inducible protein [Lysinibacillus sphaericus]